MKTLIACLSALIVASCLLLSFSCRKFHDEDAIVKWTDLISELSDIDRISRVDDAPVEILTSADPAGGNKDYNNFLRDGAEGWGVIADLKGPGYVSRFWFTGGEPDHRIRFFFDGERKPRIDTTVGEFCGGKAPFLPPLANYENYCFYNFVPIPYCRRLVIETQKGGYKPGDWPRIFYQVNFARLPAGQSVQSLPREPSARELAAIESARKEWNVFEKSYPNSYRVATNVSCGAGARCSLQRIGGPAVIRAVRVSPDFTALDSPLSRDGLLRDLVLHIRWNDLPDDSVSVPVGDFAGVLWRRTRYQSMCFGMSGDVLVSRFPMPFESCADISVENQGGREVRISVEAVVEPLTGESPAGAPAVSGADARTWDDRWGYFHAGWFRTTPEDAGKPHAILSATGRGKYVGCVLGVVSAEQSFWILEGDDTVRRDSETTPGWRGTGLEDYFNGGWYYQNVLARPFHGVPFKSPFRTVQYRVHPTDAIMFDSSFDMKFERGPDNASKGWMESTAFYYMRRPTKCFGRLVPPGERAAPPDPVAKVTVMTDIWNHERFNDYHGAMEFIEGYLLENEGFPFAEVLRLRLSAYKEKLDGFPSARPMYEKTLSDSTNQYARQLAETALWFHEDEKNALLAVYCNTKTAVFLDGKQVGLVLDPQRTFLWRVEAPEGRHVLALQSEGRPYPQWVQACLRTHGGDIATSTQWKQAFNPSGNWASLDYDDSSWNRIVGTGTKGPPDVPYLWCLPDILVDVQSKALGLCPPSQWYDEKGATVYRHVFQIP